LLYSKKQDRAHFKRDEKQLCCQPLHGRIRRRRYISTADSTGLTLEARTLSDDGTQSEMMLSDDDDEIVADQMIKSTTTHEHVPYP